MEEIRTFSSILNNENAILTVSSYDNENDLFIGYPTLINNNGAVKRLVFNLNNMEKKKLDYSIKTLKNIIKKDNWKVIFFV